MTRKETVDQWHYRIEPYRRIPGEEGWSPASENQAQAWFGFRDKGDDHRCFGVFHSRADAEKAMAMLKEAEQQPAKDDQRSQGYHTSQRRNGTEDEIIIHAPDGRHMAYIQFWEKGWDGPGAGEKEAKADAKLIIAALNAADSVPDPATRPSNAGAYHVSPGRETFGNDAIDTIDVRAPSGRSIAFAWLEPDASREDRAQVQADIRRIADALNAYQHSREGRTGMEDLRKQANESKQAEKSRTKDRDRER